MYRYFVLQYILLRGLDGAVEFEKHPFAEHRILFRIYFRHLTEMAKY